MNTHQTEDDLFADDLPGDLEEFGVEMLKDKTGFGLSTAGSVACLATGGCPFSTLSTTTTAGTYSS